MSTQRKIVRFYKIHDEDSCKEYHVYIYNDGSSAKFEYKDGLATFDGFTFNYTHGKSVFFPHGTEEKFERIEQEIREKEAKRQQDIKAREEEFKKQQQNKPTTVKESKPAEPQKEVKPQNNTSSSNSSGLISEESMNLLKQLHELKQAGILTDDEFNLKKKQILGL